LATISSADAMVADARSDGLGALPLTLFEEKGLASRLFRGQAR
jgi:hypothetical protein